MSEEHYADVSRAGSLSRFLNGLFERDGSTLRARWEVPSPGWARVESPDRLSQISTALDERLFMADFWQRGVVLANLASPDTDVLIAALRAWHEEQCTSEMLAHRFQLVKRRDHAAAYEAGPQAYVRNQWNNLISRATQEEFRKDLLPFLRLAFETSELAGLFPFTSHSTFCLSRCTGHPFSGDLPSVTPLGGGLFRVKDPRGRTTSDVEAAEAVRMVQSQVGSKGPAVHGTAEDFSDKRA